MKMTLVRGFLTVMLGAVASHSLAAERAASPGKAGEAGRTLAGYQRDCSSMADEKGKAKCEEANKAMTACKGRRAEDLAKCVMEQHSPRRP